MAQPEVAIDFYNVLGLQRACSPADIDNSYHRLQQEGLPEEQQQRVERAYAVLSVQSKRALYDRYGLRGVTLFDRAEVTVGSNMENVRRVALIKNFASYFACFNCIVLVCILTFPFFLFQKMVHHRNGTEWWTWSEVFIPVWIVNSCIAIVLMVVGLAVCGVVSTDQESQESQRLVGGGNNNNNHNNRGYDVEQPINAVGVDEHQPAVTMDMKSLRGSLVRFAVQWALSVVFEVFFVLKMEESFSKPRSWVFVFTPLYVLECINVVHNIMNTNRHTFQEERAVQTRSGIPPSFYVPYNMLGFTIRQNMWGLLRLTCLTLLSLWLDDRGSMRLSQVFASIYTGLALEMLVLVPFGYFQAVGELRHRVGTGERLNRWDVQMMHSGMKARAGMKILHMFLDFIVVMLLVDWLRDDGVRTVWLGWPFIFMITFLSCCVCGANTELARARQNRRVEELNAQAYQAGFNNAQPQWQQPMYSHPPPPPPQGEGHPPPSMPHTQSYPGIVAQPPSSG